MSGHIIWAPPEAHVRVWKNPPEILLTAMQPKSIIAWRDKNSWADNIDMIVFTDDVPPRDLAFRSFAFAEATGQCPHVVVGYPSTATLGLEKVKHATLTPVMAYWAAVAAVGRALINKRVAWLQPEADHSVGACVLASTRPKSLVLAISGRQMMDALGARAAGHHGINVQTLGTIKGKGVEDV